MAQTFEIRTSRTRERLRAALLVLGTLGVVGAVGAGVWQLIKDAGAPKRRSVQQISLVRPPLPPKPPPEPERPKEELKQEIKEVQPKEEARDDAPAPQESLGLDAQGGAGGDGFGLVGRPGGRDITSIGNAAGSGTGGRVNSAFYASQLQSELQEELNRNDKLRTAEYRALVHLWLSPAGKVTRVELAGSTGDAELDRQLRGALGEAGRLRPPPEGVSLPIRLELVAKRG